MIWIILGVVVLICILGAIDNRLYTGSGDSDSDGGGGDFDGAGGGGRDD
ncbi:hypothetical protein HYT92_00680 [Candidatus Pacearchaeota archaeon]|nr:hypothetical protein [Candidatus Pacearchaeota archaeon]